MDVYSNTVIVKAPCTLREMRDMGRMSHEKLSFIVDCTDWPIARTMCTTSVEGEWLKLAATDYDFKVNMSISRAHFRGRLGITSHTVFLLNGELEVNKFVVTKFAPSNFHHPLTRSHLWITLVILDVLRGTGLHLHPTKASRFL